ncbi:MAG: tryptophanase [Candidatus Nanoarchaeia archaeon]
MVKDMYDLGVKVPTKKSLVVRNTTKTTLAERETALKETEYNVFSFPANLLLVDYLSDSGTTAMSDKQWAALFHGDESYGRNTGYYCLLEAFRDTFERGDKRKKAINLILSSERNANTLMNSLFLQNIEGGFVNGGVFQLIRPNAFIVPQGRCAEHLLFSTLSKVLHESRAPTEFFIPSNGHFDTTEANIHCNNITPVNLFCEDILDDFPLEKIDTENPFKGNLDPNKLEAFISEKKAENIPLIYLTITNNTAAGQPVSLKNMKEISAIAQKHKIPLFFDACRFAENAYFIKQFEEGQNKKSIPEIVKEMFSYADGFTTSFKKDGLANMGGGLFFRDKGVFHQKYSIKTDIGIKLKETQILVFGNDSYGALSGRDIMALTVGLYDVIDEDYLNDRIGQVKDLAIKLKKKGVPVILPPGGHAIYINIDKFFEGTGSKVDDFLGVGLTIELIKQYGIRGCELGPFAFEWDQKSKEEQKGILNLVRFAVPRNAYGLEHIEYTVAAISELHKNKEQIPKIEIARGKELHLRHFQTGLRPVYKK